MPATALKLRIDYPRPPVTVLHAELFREAVYQDGESYAQPDDDEEP